MRWFVLLAFSVRLFAGVFDDVTPSDSEEIVSLTTDLVIDGFVSVTSGQICISVDDLIVRGAQDLSLKRTYMPPRILGRYDKKDKVDRLALGKALLQLETRGWVVHPHIWAGYNRNSKYFQIRDVQGFVLEFQIQGNKGVLKTASYGCSNLRGEKPASSTDIRNIEFLVDGDWVKVIWPDGVQRHYWNCYSGTYRLEKEILSNGKIILYEYDSQRLSKIRASDPTGKLTYASINRIGSNRYISSDGKEVDLVFERREIKGKKGNLEAKFQFPVMTKAGNPGYANTVGYNERTLLNFYDAKEYPVSCDYFQSKNTPARIKTYSNPSGSFAFSYDPAVAGQKTGSTTVTHPDGAQTIYRFSKLLLLESIENWFEDKLINKKVFTYDIKQHIKSIETLDGNGNTLIAKRFECDDAGNAILETTEGDFGVFKIKRKFDKNRVVFEEYDEGLQYIFTYLGDTRLLSSKTILESGAHLRKTLYFYDDANNLIGEEEEGKTRTAYILYQTAAHLHRIEWEEKRDWEGGLIYKIHYCYDQWGNTSKEDHFGSDDRLAYTIQRKYNEKGELLSETNPLKEKAVYEYDSRGRCVYEEPFANGLVIRRTFDNKGRLTLLQEDEQETRFEYNASDELTKKIDYLGFTTAYHYHPVHGKPDRIEEGSAITQVKYDLFGYPIEMTDATNAKTIKEYNSYGDIAQITHPEGGQERFSYYPNGLLKSYRNPDGLTTAYKYDVLGRIKEKTVGTRTTTFEYDGYNLLKKIDPAGFVTRYRYDLADRKVEETRGDRTTRYGYDSLGFLSWEEKGRHRSTYINDPLGRVLAKSVDGVLETFLTYDAGGNVSSIKQGGTTEFLYDAHNRLIQKMDPEGNKTVISYARGSKGLIEKITNADIIETVNSYDSKGQLLTKEIDGQIGETREYDQMFRLCKQDHICFGFTPNGNRGWMQEAAQRTTYWTHTPGNLTLSKQKPDGTVLPYQYDEQLLLTSIGYKEFRYDQLGRLIGGTGFSRTLDPFGNILREEWINGLWIETDYDELDRPIIRRLPDFSRIEYEYYGPFLKQVTRISNRGEAIYSHIYDHFDASGNPETENGFFQTSYKYDKKGRRISQTNSYFMEEIEYSPSGNLLRKGNTTYTYDSLSQMTSESEKFTGAYDIHYNLRSLNNRSIEVDSLNQIATLQYDLNGNLIKPGFVYDEFDQLIEIGGERLTYDALGRRIQRGETAFLYVGDEEIGAFEQGKPRELKVPGKTEPIAIEIDQVHYAPIVDVQGVIRFLVDPRSQEVFKQNDCDAFGMGLSEGIPYAYAGKRYDSKTGLIYFGKRYYDPILRRWLTADPIGPIDHSNLYQYVFNNPYRFQDPNGESIGGYLLGLGEIILGGTIMAGGFALEVVTFGGFTFGLGVTTSTGAALMGLGLATTAYNSQDIKATNVFWNKPQSPPYDWSDLGSDPSVSPKPGFEWKGKGKPGTGKGSWVKGQRGAQEILYPDLDHPPPIGPHWDYESPDFPKGVRIFPNGTWSPK